MRQVIAVDVNNDTKLDLVTANQDDGTVSVLLGNGLGAFATKVDYAAVTSAYCVASGDFNNDGKVDLAVGGKFTNQFAILRGNGNGTFQAPLFFTAAQGIVSIIVADFNKDGRPDVATANEAGGATSAGNVTVLLGNASVNLNVTFQTPVVLSTGINQPSAVAAGDFNKDGNLDLAVANPFGDNVRVVPGAGNGTFAAGTSFGTGSTPSGLAVLDVDADGWADLAVACKSDGTTEISGGVSVLRNHRDGTFESPLTCTGHTSPVAVATADFNGDGLSDLVAANLYSDDASMMLNDRGAPTGTIIGTVFDDANGNGTKDAADIGSAGRVVYLDTNGNGAPDPGEPTALTDGVGQYVFPPLAPGTYTVRLAPVPGAAQTSPANNAAYAVTLAAGQQATFTFGLHDGTPPAMFAAQFLPDAPAMAVRIVFDENVGPSLAAADFQLKNLSTGQAIPTANVLMNYAPGSFVATFTFAGYPGSALPDGDYRATFAAGSINDASGNATAQPYTADFFVMAADGNHDRTVDFNDLVLLAQNYNTAGGKTHAQDDYNYDGNVDFNDLVILAQRYNTTLTSATAAPAPASPAVQAAVLAMFAPPPTANPPKAAAAKPSPVKSLFASAAPIQKPKLARPAARK